MEGRGRRAGKINDRATLIFSDVCIVIDVVFSGDTEYETFHSDHNQLTTNCISGHKRCL